MSVARLVFLVGMFGPPLLLLAMGRSYRQRSVPARGAFWGGVFGYGVGVVLTLLAMLEPAVAWSDSLMRELTVHGGLLAGSVVGMGSGWALGARRGGAALD